MSEKTIMNAHFFLDEVTLEELVRVERAVSGGGMETKTVGVEEFVNCLSTERVGYGSGKHYQRLRLPEGVYDVLLDGVGGYAVVSDRKERYMLYGTSQGQFMVRIPAFVFITEVTKEGWFTRCCVYAYDGNRKLCDSTPLYWWPFGHVYADHHICMGSVPNNVPSIQAVDDVIAGFLDARDLAHLDNPMTRKNGHSVISLLEELQAAGDVPFDYSRLMPVGVTLGTVLEQFAKEN